MEVSVILEDQVIVVDGNAVFISGSDTFELPDNIRAIQFNNGSGHVEYLDERSNKKIDQAFFDSNFSFLVKLHRDVFVASRIAELSVPVFDSSVDRPFLPS